MKIRKIIISLLGIVLIAILLQIVNDIWGNPVSKMLATKAVKKYVDENYSNLNLELDAPYYNFKFDCYGVLAKSKTSQDTIFRIYTDGLGNITQDDYEYEVENCFTTLRRLESELDEKAKELIVKNLDYDYDIASIRFIEDNKDSEWYTKLKLDIELNIYNPPRPLETYISIFTNDVTWNKIAEVTLSLEKVLESQNIPISQYSIMLIPIANKPEERGVGVSWVNALSVSNFPSDLLKENNLPEVMEQFEKDSVTSH